MQLNAPLAVLVAGAGAGAFALSMALVACESATNLDVVYADASADVEAAVDGAPVLPPNTFPGCPCDEKAGLGCCVRKTGEEPFCTSDPDLCTMRGGAYLRCGRGDSTTESVCCWSYTVKNQSAGAVTALASACDGGMGTIACTDDSDCSGTDHKTCNTSTCGAIKLGQCADAPPSCP